MGGLVSRGCFSNFGHDVICIGKDPARIEKLNRSVVRIFELGLDQLIARNVEVGRLISMTDLKEVVDGAEAMGMLI